MNIRIFLIDFIYELLLSEGGHLFNVELNYHCLADDFVNQVRSCIPFYTCDTQKSLKTLESEFILVHSHTPLQLGIRPTNFIIKLMSVLCVSVWKDIHIVGISADFHVIFDDKQI